MSGRFHAILASVSLAFLLGGCPSSDLTGLSIVPSTYSGQSGQAGAGSAADAAANASNPADRDTTSSSGVNAASAVQSFPDCSTPRQEAEWQDAIMSLVNQERGRAGLAPVRRNTTLEAQAGQYACEMIHYDFFDHVNPVTRTTLGERASQFGYDYSVVGENLAAGQTSPEQVFADWMNSPGHRQNILDGRFTELGVGIRAGGDYGLYWVQEFGRPRTAR